MALGGWKTVLALGMVLVWRDISSRSFNCTFIYKVSVSSHVYSQLITRHQVWADLERKKRLWKVTKRLIYSGCGCLELGEKILSNTIFESTHVSSVNGFIKVSTASTCVDNLGMNWKELMWITRDLIWFFCCFPSIIRIQYVTPASLISADSNF